jgi:hypothetical protein
LSPQKNHERHDFGRKFGIDYRACRKWLDVIHGVAKDLAVWEKSDINYNANATMRTSLWTAAWTAMTKGKGLVLKWTTKR